MGVNPSCHQSTLAPLFLASSHPTSNRYPNPPPPVDPTNPHPPTPGGDSTLSVLGSDGAIDALAAIRGIGRAKAAAIKAEWDRNEGARPLPRAPCRAPRAQLTPHHAARAARSRRARTLLGGCAVQMGRAQLEISATPS